MNTSIFQVYRTRTEARAVLRACEERGIVGGPDRQLPAGFGAALLQPMDLTTGRKGENSPMCGAGRDKQYYAVYCGIKPGVYDNW